MRSLMLLFLMLSVPAAFVAAVPGAGGVNSDTVSSTIERSAVNAGAGLDAVSGPGESPGGGMIDLDEMGHVVTIGDDSDQYFIRVASAGSMRTIIVGGPCGRRLIAPALVSRLASSSILAYADTAGSS